MRHIRMNIDEKFKIFVKDLELKRSIIFLKIFKLEFC